jgi:hypothetical protein
MRPTPWAADATTWTRNRLTILIDYRFPGTTFDRDAQGLIAWVTDGMTPTTALEWASRHTISLEFCLQMALY